MVKKLNSTLARALNDYRDEHKIGEVELSKRLGIGQARLHEITKGIFKATPNERQVIRELIGNRYINFE